MGGIYWNLEWRVNLLYTLVPILSYILHIYVRCYNDVLIPFVSDANKLLGYDRVWNYTYREDGQLTWPILVLKRSQAKCWFLHFILVFIVIFYKSRRERPEDLYYDVVRTILNYLVKPRKTKIWMTKRGFNFQSFQRLDTATTCLVITLNIQKSRAYVSINIVLKRS